MRQVRRTPRRDTITTNPTYGHDHPSRRRATSPHVAAFNFDDLAAEAAEYLAQARAEAAEIVAKAESQADDIRRQAAEAGCKAAMQEVEQMVAEQVAPAIDALRQAVAELHREKQAWLSHWETGAVHLAAAIAARVIRRELRQQPEITLTLVREALELAAGSPNVRLHLNPEDHKSLGAQVRTLIDAMSALGDAEVTADADDQPRRLPRRDPLRHDRPAVRVATEANRRGIDGVAMTSMRISSFDLNLESLILISPHARPHRTTRPHHADGADGQRGADGRHDRLGGRISGAGRRRGRNPAAVGPAAAGRSGRLPRRPDGALSA